MNHNKKYGKKKIKNKNKKNIRKENRKNLEEAEEVEAQTLILNLRRVANLMEDRSHLDIRRNMIIMIGMIDMKKIMIRKIIVTTVIGTTIKTFNKIEKLGKKIVKLEIMIGIKLKQMK